MQTLQIVIGLLIIGLIYLDFFHTTLSGNGFGFFTRISNQALNRLILKNKNRLIFDYSGFIHLLITTFLWLFIMFLGVFIIYTSGEEMVVHATTGLPATNYERFYFTGYVLSTLGIGDFVPGSTISRVITGILSFSGLILITIGLTYLLSIISAVLSKKQLSFFISTIGEDIEEMYKYFRNQNNLESLISDEADLKQQILSNASNYLAFPMVSYFLSRQRKSALILQLAALYEVLVVLSQEWKSNSIQRSKIISLIAAIEKYLELGLEEPDAGKYNPDELRTLRSYWKGLGYDFNNDSDVDRQFSSSLQYAGWTWEDVYKLKDFQQQEAQKGPTKQF